MENCVTPGLDAFDVLLEVVFVFSQSKAMCVRIYVLSHACRFPFISISLKFCKYVLRPWYCHAQSWNKQARLF